jgi:hypothetical protein
MSQIDIMPTREDLFSVGFAALGSYLMKMGKPEMEALSQLFSVVIAKNLASGISMTDGAEGITIKEYDIYTGGVRAGVSAFQKGGANNVMYAAFNGIAANLLGRFTSSKMVNNL